MNRRRPRTPFLAAMIDPGRVRALANRWPIVVNRSELHVLTAETAGVSIPSRNLQSCTAPRSFGFGQ